MKHNRTSTAGRITEVNVVNNVRDEIPDGETEDFVHLVRMSPTYSGEGKSIHDADS